MWAVFKTLNVVLHRGEELAVFFFISYKKLDSSSEFRNMHCSGLFSGLLFFKFFFCVKKMAERDFSYIA